MGKPPHRRGRHMTWPFIPQAQGAAQPPVARRAEGNASGYHMTPSRNLSPVRGGDRKPAYNGVAGSPVAPPVAPASPVSPTSPRKPYNADEVRDEKVTLEEELKRLLGAPRCDWGARSRIDELQGLITEKRHTLNMLRLTSPTPSVNAETQTDTDLPALYGVMPFTLGSLYTYYPPAEEHPLPLSPKNGPNGPDICLDFTPTHVLNIQHQLAELTLKCSQLTCELALLKGQLPRGEAPAAAPSYPPRPSTQQASRQKSSQSLVQPSFPSHHASSAQSNHGQTISVQQSAQSIHQQSVHPTISGHISAQPSQSQQSEHAVIHQSLQSLQQQQLNSSFQSVHTMPSAAPSVGSRPAVPHMSIEAPMDATQPQPSVPEQSVYEDYHSSHQSKVPTPSMHPSAQLSRQLSVQQSAPSLQQQSVHPTISGHVSAPSQQQEVTPSPHAGAHQPMQHSVQQSSQANMSSIPPLHPSASMHEDRRQSVQFSQQHSAQHLSAMPSAQQLSGHPSVQHQSTHSVQQSVHPTLSGQQQSQQSVHGLQQPSEQRSAMSAAQPQHHQSMQSAGGHQQTGSLQSVHSAQQSSLHVSSTAQPLSHAEHDVVSHHQSMGVQQPMHSFQQPSVMQSMGHAQQSVQSMQRHPSGMQSGHQHQDSGQQSVQSTQQMAHGQHIAHSELQQSMQSMYQQPSGQVQQSMHSMHQQPSVHSMQPQYQEPGVQQSVHSMHLQQSGQMEQQPHSAQSGQLAPQSTFSMPSGHPSVHQEASRHQSMHSMHQPIVQQSAQPVHSMQTPGHSTHQHESTQHQMQSMHQSAPEPSAQGMQRQQSVQHSVHSAQPASMHQPSGHGMQQPVLGFQSAQQSVQQASAPQDVQSMQRQQSGMHSEFVVSQQSAQVERGFDPSVHGTPKGTLPAGMVYTSFEEGGGQPPTPSVHHSMHSEKFTPSVPTPATHALPTPSMKPEGVSRQPSVQPSSSEHNSVPSMLPVQYVSEDSAFSHSSLGDVEAAKVKLGFVGAHWPLKEGKATPVYIVSVPRDVPLMHSLDLINQKLKTEIRQYKLFYNTRKLPEIEAGDQLDLSETPKEMGFRSQGVVIIL